MTDLVERTRQHLNEMPDDGEQEVLNEFISLRTGLIGAGLAKTKQYANQIDGQVPYPVGDMRGVFLPLIFWCLKMGENGGFGMLHLVGFNTDVKTPLHPHSIFSTHSEYSLSDFPYETPDR